MGYVKLAELIEKYGKGLVGNLYIDDKMTIEEIEKSLKEKEQRIETFAEALRFIENKK